MLEQHHFEQIVDAWSRVQVVICCNSVKGCSNSSQQSSCQLCGKHKDEHSSLYKLPPHAQAAAAMQAERMRRTLEARAVVAQVAEQKEAGRAAMAAAQVEPASHQTALHLIPKCAKIARTSVLTLVQAETSRHPLRINHRCLIARADNACSECPLQ